MTLTLPNNVAEGNFLLATVALQTASNSDCAGYGAPYACCAGTGTGTCQDASAGTIEVPAGWTEIRHDTCGSDLTMSIAYRIAQPGDSGVSQFTWSFIGAGQPADSSLCTDYGTPYACCTGNATGTCPYTPFLASGGVTELSNVDTTTPVEDNSFQCTDDSVTLTAPSITTTEDNSLVLVVYGITGSNFLRAPSGYSEICQHNIAGSGPDFGNFSSDLIPTSGTASGDQTSTATNAGDNIGYQLGLSPPLP